jgi:hypothetical protein
VRGIFFDEEVAARVAARLERDGYEAHVVRERFAGEDDDEDHPWAVVTEAPEFVLEVLVDEHDGWLDADEMPEPGSTLELPDAPRRGSRGDSRRY